MNYLLLKIYQALAESPQDGVHKQTNLGRTSCNTTARPHKCGPNNFSTLIKHSFHCTDGSDQMLCALREEVMQRGKMLSQCTSSRKLLFSSYCNFTGQGFFRQSEWLFFF